MPTRPLRPFQLSLLTALSAGEAHAYAIAHTMIHDVQGAIVVRHRDVYRELSRLTAGKLVESVPETRPIRFRLTPQGRRTLAFERAHALEVHRLLQERL